MFCISILQCDPLRGWENKYHAEGGTPLTSDEVAYCGRQILEVCMCVRACERDTSIPSAYYIK